MTRAVTFVTCCLTLVACGGGSDTGTNPPPPPVNRVASLAAVDTSILQFTGKKVALSKLFVAKDAAGVAIPNAYLSCVTPAGFTLTGDSLVAPTVESRGKLRCSATTIAPSAMMLAPALAGGLTPTDSMTVTAGIDLRGSAWHVHYRCTGGLGYWDQLGGTSTRADSVDYEGIGTWVYPGDSGYVRSNLNVGATFTATPTITLFKGDSVAWRGQGGAVPYTAVMTQAVDTLFLVDNLNSYARDTLVAVSASPRTYRAHSWCDSQFNSLQRPLSPVTLEAVVP